MQMQVSVDLISLIVGNSGREAQRRKRDEWENELLIVLFILMLSSRIYVGIRFPLNPIRLFVNDQKPQPSSHHATSRRQPPLTQSLVLDDTLCLRSYRQYDTGRIDQVENMVAKMHEMMQLEYVSFGCHSLTVS